MLNDFTKKNMICWCKKRKVSLSCVRKLLHLGHLKKRKIDHSVTVKMDEKQIIDGCVSLVRESGRPFKILDDKGFSMILDPLLEGLSWSLTISAENIVPKINLAAQMMHAASSHKPTQKCILHFLTLPFSFKFTAELGLKRKEQRIPANFF